MVPTWMIMAPKHKATSLQLFSEEKLLHWRELLQLACGVSDTQRHLFEALYQAGSQQEQLKALKKIKASLQELTCGAHGDDSYTAVLRVLTEIHYVCDSHHPLQRAIVSIFQGLPGGDHVGVVDTISANIAAVFDKSHSTFEFNYGDHSLAFGRRIDYLDVLMENFDLGELALKRQLPVVLRYCVQNISTLSRCNSSSHGMGLLLALLKVTIKLMHKLAPAVGEMLEKKEPDHSVDKESVFDWLDVHKGGTLLEKSEWTEGQLTELEQSCQNLLTNVDLVPHDTAVAAAMLLFVVFNITSSSFQQPPSGSLESLLSGRLERWFAELKPFAQLALCHGMLAKLPPHLLLSTRMEEKPLLVSLFPKVCRLFDSFTETSDRYLASRTIALWTSVTRDCAHCVSPSSVLYQYVVPSSDVMQKLLQLVWSLWEDPVDGIRHQCRDMFENAIKIYQHLQKCGGSEDCLLSLARNLLSLDSPTRGKFVLLSSLSHHLPALEFLSVSPQLPSELMSVMGHQALACHAGDLWSSLVCRHWKELTSGDGEMNEDTWNKTWVCPLVEAMCTASPLARKHVVQHCLPALFQCSVKCMHHINTHLHCLSSVSSDSKLTVQLACLRCARMESKEFDAAASESFGDLFATAMHHADEQIRLSALGLLCESHRTTEPPLPDHLQLLFSFVELNSNSQSPGFRYPAITAFKKLFIRIRDSSYALLKLHQKRRCENPESQISSFRTFLQELLNQQFKVLHPLSSFQRRSFSLSLLQLMAAIFDEPNSSSASNPSSSEPTSSEIPSIFDFPSAISSCQARCLLEGLLDPFDANRSVCLELLLKLDANLIKLTESAFVCEQTAAYLSRVQSPKSVSCTSASFQLKLHLQKCPALFGDCLTTLILQDQVSVKKEEETRPPFFRVIDLLCKLLRRHVSEASKDLVKSSMFSPMYGVIQSVRAAYESLGAESYVQDCLHHREAVAAVMAVCADVAKIASPVVCSSSPEGFLPDGEEDFCLMEDHRLESSLGSVQSGDSQSESQEDIVKIQTVKGGMESALLKSAESSKQGSAQSLLLCCWHSMKEIALLFGHLTEYAPVINESTTGVEEKGVITHAQLDTIAKIFIHQLTEARHRGAFEMAYSGFSKLCRCLWTNSSPEPNMKPQHWVKDLLDSLESTSLARLLSITRRSAGLPFYLQAILTAEPAHTGRRCLKSTMETLLRVATESTACPTPSAVSEQEMAAERHASSSPPPSSSSQPAAVHALNILRALYRDSRLGEYIVPFIPQGVVIAIEGFSASLWPVRNSSTLLFSALVTRIFGAKRVQDEHSMENKMTAKEFFTRFPTLHGFLLKQLGEGVRHMGLSNGDSLQPSLFPLLLLLSRLYPSPLDETNSPVSMKPFLPLLLSCTCCTVWKTRVLAAHTITSMITEQNTAHLLAVVYDKMDLTNQNALHGLLLVVDAIVKDHSKLLLKCCDHAGEETAPLSHSLLMFHLNKRCLASRKNECVITRGLYLNILVNILVTLLKTSPPSLQKGPLLRQLQEVITECYLAVQPGYFEQQVAAKDLAISQLRLLLWCLSRFDCVVVDDARLSTLSLLKLCLQDDQPLHLRTFCLEFINGSGPDASDDVIVERVLNLLCSETDSDFLIQTFVFASNFSTIEKMCSGNKCGALLNQAVQKAYKLILQRCNRLELRTSVVKFLCTALACVDPVIGSKDAYLSSLVPHLESICIPTQPYEMRVAVANQLHHIWSAVLDSSVVKEVVPTCCQLIVNLLQDSDVDVRTAAATSVARLLPAGVGLSVQSPSPSSAMEWFVNSIPAMASDPSVALLKLVPREKDEDTLSGGASNPLFDEDPINEYAEDVVLLRHVSNCLRGVVKSRQELTHVDREVVVDYLATKMADMKLTQEEHWEEAFPLGVSVWDNQRCFWSQVRQHFLQGAVRNSCLDGATNQGTREQLHTDSKHPIFS